MNTEDGDLQRASSRTFSRREALRLGAWGALAAAGGLALAACGGGTASPKSTSTTVKPKAGGSLRVGIDGGSSSDTLDANGAVAYPDWCRFSASMTSWSGRMPIFSPTTTSPKKSCRTCRQPSGRSG